VALLVGVGAAQAFRIAAVLLPIAVVVDLIIAVPFGRVDVDRGVRAIGLLLLLALAVVTGMLGRMVGGMFSDGAITVVVVIGSVAAGRAEGGVAAIIIGVLLVVVSKRAMRDDARDREIGQLAHRNRFQVGTRFTGADISGADFQGAPTLLGRRGQAVNAAERL
jgi:hypothetical protein